MLLKKLSTLFTAALFVLTLNGIAQAGEHTIEIKGMAFSPATLSLSVGDKVTFINKDGAPHTGTATDGSFDTGQLSKGESATITLSKAGDFDYFCAVHPSMKGKFTVK